MDNNELLKTADGAALAYLGDCVFEMWVREKLLRSGITNTGALNEESHKYVTAKSQSAAFHRIVSLLTEDEMAYFKRGRNSTHLSGARSASGAEYRTATGFESLCAALYLEGAQERLKELLEKAYNV
ncbi:MAG: hypothetical protein IJA60_00715 [Clostridia bacterium]|nr:hypothetical protein [Clostridia bacterium]